MSAAPEFASRLKRLSAVSAVALGIIWRLAVTRAQVPNWAGALLLMGWLTMPTLLLLSLKRPALRYFLIVPSTLVLTGVLTALLHTADSEAMQRLGWGLMTLGVAFGASLGSCFWFRWIRPPARLEAPFSAGRWALVAIHIGLVITGIILVFCC